jgi:hypothetical protein
VELNLSGVKFSGGGARLQMSCGDRLNIVCKGSDPASRASLNGPWHLPLHEGTRGIW